MPWRKSSLPDREVAMTKHIDDEVQFHIDEATEALIKQGWSSDAARAEAERRFGGTVRYRRQLSALSRVDAAGHAIRQLLSANWRDSVRALRAAPMVTLAAVLSLALGIGANTALFSIVNGLLLKPLPVHEPDQLALLAGDDWTNPIWEHVRDHAAGHFAGVAAWANQNFDLAESGESEMVDGAYVSGSFFAVLGVHPAIGRMVSKSDDLRGGGADGPIAVISHALWQRRFGGTPAIVGRRLSVNHLPFIVVGVAPPTFFGLEVGRAADVYLPIAAEALIRGSESRLDERSAWWLEVIVRRHPDQTIEDATRVLNAARPEIRAATIPARFLNQPRAEYLNQDFRLVDARTGESALRSRFGGPLVTVTIIVAGVLLIACANVANLLLARATARRQEMSVRLALGASWVHITRQLLAEAVLLCGVGGAIGLVIAQWGGVLLVRQLESSVSSVTLDLSMDWRVLGVTAGIAMVTTILFALAPVAGLAGVRPNHALGHGGRGIVGDRRPSLRNALVVVQVAVSLVLVVTAGLFVRSFYGLATTPLGFSSSDLVIVTVDASRSNVAPDALPELYQRVADAAAAAGGVRHASASLVTPLSGRGWNNRVAMPDGSEPPRDRVTFENAVGPDWFTTYGMRILAGRDLSRQDTKGAPPVVVVNEMFVRRFLGETPPIGARVSVGPPQAAQSFEVVGVVNDAVYRSARRGVVPTMYHPLQQAGTLNMSFAVTLDVPANRADLIPALRRVLRQADPAIGFSVRDYSDVIRTAIAEERLVAILSGFFGALAMLLAGIGLYGLTAYAVGSRTAELAIRMALGADTRTVVRLVLRSVATVVVCGAAIGIAVSFWASKFVTALLFRVEARDPITLAGATATLTVVALVAGYMPARRAARLDPNIVLRR
jgi:putative ABC transport system permease protein